jgi:hypothetical protein
LSLFLFSWTHYWSRSVVNVFRKAYFKHWNQSLRSFLSDLCYTFLDRTVMVSRKAGLCTLLPVLTRRSCMICVLSVWWISGRWWRWSDSKTVAHCFCVERNNEFPWWELPIVFRLSSRIFHCWQ